MVGFHFHSYYNWAWLRICFRWIQEAHVFGLSLAGKVFGYHEGCIVAARHQSVVTDWRRFLRVLLRPSGLLVYISSTVCMITWLSCLQGRVLWWTWLRNKQWLNFHLYSTSVVAEMMAQIFFCLFFFLLPQLNTQSLHVSQFCPWRHRG